MTVDGTWAITIAAEGLPTQDGTLELRSTGTNVTGVSTVTGFAPVPVADGSIHGDRLLLRVPLVDPMPMEVNFAFTVAADELIGEAVVSGGMPTAKVHGKRSAGPVTP